MKVAMVQCNFTVGDFSGNANKIIAAYKKACTLGADLVITSELSLFGYPPKDMLELHEYVEEQYTQLERIGRLVADVPLVLGVAERCGMGKQLYNSAHVAYRGKNIFSQHKSLLPTYDVFDEHRYFEPWHAPVRIFTHNEKRIGILVCEDIWGGTEIVNGHKLYTNNPVHALARYRPDLLVVINSSPYYWGKGRVRYDLVSDIAQELRCPVFYVNQVGGNDDLIFDGRSFGVNAKGRCIAAAKPFMEDLILTDLDQPEIRDYISGKDEVGDIYQALVLGARDYLRKIGCTAGAVIGLSGGIDSAVTACIASDALGPDNVVGVRMPSEFSSAGSLQDAELLAKNLGIALETVPIERIYDVFGDSVRDVIGWYPPDAPATDVTEENVQARMRGAILMAISNRIGKIVLSTGNKSEIACGYCTLYGDMVGGLGVLADVPKTVVYALADFINREREIIPRSTITKPPSAELRLNQKDTDSLPPYDTLDRILYLYIEEQKSLKEIVQEIGDIPVVQRVIRMVNRNEFKRRQMALGLKVTGKAFGAGRRFPIAAKFLT